MFLNLGCGSVRLIHQQHVDLMQKYAPLSEWTLVDKYADQPDFDTFEPTKHLNKQIKTWDATKLDEVPDGSCKVIYASHLLEHFPHIHSKDILKLWTRKLEKGGKLIINVPDLFWAAKEISKYEKGFLLDGYYNEIEGEHGLLSVIYGSQSHEGEYHKAGFTKKLVYQLFADCYLIDLKVETLVDAHDMGVIIAEGTKE